MTTPSRCVEFEVYRFPLITLAEEARLDLRYAETYVVTPDGDLTTYDRSTGESTGYVGRKTALFDWLEDLRQRYGDVAIIERPGQYVLAWLRDSGHVVPYPYEVEKETGRSYYGFVESGKLYTLEYFGRAAQNHALESIRGYDEEKAYEARLFDLTARFGDALRTIAANEPGARVSPARLEADLGASRLEIEGFINGAVHDGRLRPADVTRCGDCGKQPDGAFDAKSFHCDECGSNESRTQRLYSLTDKVGST